VKLLLRFLSKKLQNRNLSKKNLKNEFTLKKKFPRDNKDENRRDYKNRDKSRLFLVQKQT